MAETPKRNRQRRAFGELTDCCILSPEMKPVRTVDTKDGRIQWQIEGTPSVGNVLGAPAPVVTSDLAVFAFGSGDIAATFKRGGISRWNASVAGGRRGRATARIVDVTGSPMVVGDTIFIGNHSGRTVAFDAGTGERRWTADEGAVDTVWPAGNSIFLISDPQPAGSLEQRRWFGDLGAGPTGLCQRQTKPSRSDRSPLWPDLGRRAHCDRLK